MNQKSKDQINNDILKGKKSPLLLKKALEDPIRKKYGLNITFHTATKETFIKGWNKWSTKNQNEEEIIEVYDKRYANYAYVTGFNGLFGIDFDWEWPYHLCKNHFKKRFETYTIRTPNKGYRCLFITKNPTNNDKFKNKLHVELQGGKPAIVHGKAKDENGKIGKYVPIQTVSIQKDQNILNDVETFLNKVLEKCYFIEYPCIKSILKRKKNQISHEQRTNIAQFFKAENIDKKTAIDFFRCSDNFDLNKTEDHINKIYKKNFQHPKCKTLQENFNFKESDCGNCPRKNSLSEKNSNNYAKSELDSLNDFLMKTKENDQHINHGMDLNPKLGLCYITTVPSKFDVQGVFGICQSKPIQATISKLELKRESAEDLYLCKGFHNCLNDRCFMQIRELIKEVNKTDKIKSKFISELFDDIVQMEREYLEFQNNDEYYIISLWIMGTFMRVIFNWFPYLVFYGLRDVGKSTSLSFISLTSFNGDGIVTGGFSDSSIFREISSTKGVYVIDHLQEVLKSKEKRQIANQILENAWYLHSAYTRTDPNTLYVEKFPLASSISIGTSELDSNNSLEEKGIIITMYDAKNPKIRQKSAKMYDDKRLWALQKSCLSVALKYHEKVIKSYKNLKTITGLYGREYNKFGPMIAIAQIIDQEKPEIKLENKIVSYAIEYAKKRKSNSQESEELLMKLIIKENVCQTTYKELAALMREKMGFKKYSYQKAQSDLNKLGIIKSKTNSTPIRIYIDLERAKDRAIRRGINLEDESLNECEINDLMNRSIAGDENAHSEMEAKIIEKTSNEKKRQ